MGETLESIRLLLKTTPADQLAITTDLGQLVALSEIADQLGEIAKALQSIDDKLDRLTLRV